MKRLTISKVDKSADRRKVLAGISATAAATATAILGAQQIIGQIRKNSQPGRFLGIDTAAAARRVHNLGNQKMTRSAIELHVVSEKLWDTPLSDRPISVFNKGQLSQMLEISGKLFDDSPAAAIALMDFFVLQRSEVQADARARLTTLLQRCNTRAIALRSAQLGNQETQQSSDGRLTVALCKYELAFLQRISGETTRNTPDLVTLVEELQQLSARFKDRDSQRRQGATRVILADILLRLGQVDGANRQMSQALVLLGTVYEDRELMLLSVNVNGRSIIDQTFGPSSDEAQQKAYLLVSDD